MKDRVAVEVQFGKYSFIAYDLFVKHMAFFVGDMIDLGIEILPTKAMQTQMSSGPGYYEHALYSIVRQGRGVPAVPLALIGIEADTTPSLEEVAATDGGIPADHPEGLTSYAGFGHHLGWARTFIGRVSRRPPTPRSQPGAALVKGKKWCARQELDTR